MLRYSPLLVAVVALGFCSIATADIPPPPDYVERCTIKKQQKPGEVCVLCSDAYFRKPDACKDRYEPLGYGKRCRTRGASTWSEVWCGPRGTVKTPAAPTPTPTTAPAPKRDAPRPAAPPTTK